MTINTKLINNIRIPLYLFILCGYVVLSVLNASPIKLGPVMKGYNVLVIIVNIYLILKKRKYSSRTMVWMLLLFMVFMVSAYCCHSLDMVVFLTFIIAADCADCDLYTIIKGAFISEMASVALIVFLCLIHILPDYQYLHGTKMAHSFGFFYYSAIPFYMFFCTLMYIFLRGKKIRAYEFLILEIVHYVIYNIFTLRLTYYLSVVLILAAFFLIMSNSITLNKKWIRRISTILFPLCEIVNIVICRYLYNPDISFWKQMDEILSHRLSQVNYAFHNYPIPLFGQVIPMRGNATLALGETTGSYFYIDSGYIYSLMVYGVFFTVLLMIVYSILMNAVCRNNDKGLYIWLIAILTFSFLNSALLNVLYSTLLLGLIGIVKNRGSWKPRIQEQEQL